MNIEMSKFDDWQAGHFKKFCAFGEYISNLNDSQEFALSIMVYVIDYCKMPHHPNSNVESFYHILLLKLPAQSEASYINIH